MATPTLGGTKVLYCEGNTDGTIGGSYYSLLFLVEGLKGTRYRPVVVFHREHELLARYRESAEVHIIEKRRSVRLAPGDSEVHSGGPVRSPLLRWLQRGANALGFLLTVGQYARLLRRERIALVHLNNSVTRSHEWILAALITRTPCVVHERGINGTFSMRARLLAPRVAGIICISKAVRQNLLDHDVARSKVCVIENGLDPERVRPRQTAQAVRRALRIADDRRVVGLVGNIKEWKGQEVLVRALPAIATAIPNVLCLFVGATSDSDRYYLDRLRILISQLAMERHVVFAGFTGNVADYLNLMDVAIHASIAPEPFGRVVLEAMAMRLPVVGSRGGGIPEIIEHGVTGFTFEPGDYKELADHVVRLLEHPAIARAMGEAAYARLAQRFHISRNVSRTLALYDTVLLRPRSRGRWGLGGPDRTAES